jgi:hypothetical protein
MKRKHGSGTWRRLLICLGVGIVWWQGPYSLAGSVLDAHFDLGEPLTTSSGTNSNTEHAQTFTVLNTGQLTAFEIWVKPPQDAGDLLVDVRPTRPGDEPGAARLPVEDDNAALASFVWEWDDWTDGGTPKLWLSFDVTNDDIQVSAGEQLALVMRAPDSSWPFKVLGHSPSNPGPVYAGGVPCERVIGNHDWVDFSIVGDYDFRTYVNPVPEPGTFLQCIGGFAVLMMLGRRICHNSIRVVQRPNISEWF